MGSKSSIDTYGGNLSCQLAPYWERWLRQGKLERLKAKINVHCIPLLYSRIDLSAVSLALLCIN